MNKNYQKWDELAPRGLLVMGFGFSMLGQAIIARVKKRGFLRWFGLGTIALVAINAGVSIFGEAVKYRTLYELDIKKLQDED